MGVEYKYSRFIFFNLHSHLQRYKVFDIRAPIFRSFLIFFFAFFFPNKTATGWKQLSSLAASKIVFLDDIQLETKYAV